MLSLALSIVPIAALAVALSVFHVRAHLASFGAMVLTLVLTLVFFRGALPPVQIPPVALDGARFALCPICLVILGALFVYSLTVESGAMQTIREGLLGVSSDSRIVVLLIVWGFGNFMEGMAGFGTAVAIPAAILVGVGFDPVKAVLMCLVANTTPTVFGSAGVPLMTLAEVSGCEPKILSGTAAGLQLVVTALGPILILLVLDGVRALKGMWGYILVADAAFLVPWLLSACFLGPALPDILSGLCVMVCVALVSLKSRRPSLRAQLYAWSPFAFVVVLLALAAVLPPSMTACVPVGVLILLGGFAGGLVQHVAPSRMCRVLGRTVRSYWTAFATICCVLVLARVMTASGMIRTIADALVDLTGPAYPLFAPLVGALGGFVTGSGTSANVLFGALQSGAAAKLGLSANLLSAANVMGAGIGKMICPQSIAIGTAAALIPGRAGDVFRKALGWFLVVIIVACLTCGGAAYL